MFQSCSEKCVSPLFCIKVWAFLAFNFFSSPFAPVPIFFFLLKMKRFVFLLTDHFSQNHVLESPNSPVLQGKVERGSTGIKKNPFLLTQN